MTRTLLPLLAVAALLPAPAFAASHDLATFIGEYDLDGNGVVSKEEFQKERERRFASTDVNHDGGISLEEYLTEFRARLMFGKPEPGSVEKQMKQTGTRFGVLDSNKDGRILPAEYFHSGWNMFNEHDYNRDGAISAEDRN